MPKKAILFVLGGLTAAPAFATDNYTVDPRHTFPSFEINHLGFSIQRGRFNETSGKINIDPKSGTGAMHIIINTGSISTGLAELEKKLRSDEFLDAEKFPQMTYTANRLTFDKETLKTVDGNLTLHGVTKPVHLTVDYFHCGINLINQKHACGANATATIKRSDFGVSKFVPAVADEVKIEIQIEAFKD
jgi:polyisoprenoid-binding protein YceI